MSRPPQGQPGITANAGDIEQLDPPNATWSGNTQLNKWTHSLYQRVLGTPVTEILTADMSNDWTGSIRFWKTSDDTIHMEGNVSNLVSSNLVIFNLPVNFRPEILLHFSVVGQAGNFSGEVLEQRYVSVKTDGDVKATVDTTAGGTPPASVHIAGLSWRAA